MIPTHFVDRMSKTLSGWLEGEGMSESLVEEARAEAKQVRSAWPTTYDLITRLADRVEELEAALAAIDADDEGWTFVDHGSSRDQHQEVARQALSPPMDK